MNSTPKTDAVMPLVIAMINRDVMPLIKKVLIKRAELYLREIEKYDAEGTPASTLSPESNTDAQQADR